MSDLAQRLRSDARTLRVSGYVLKLEWARRMADDCEVAADELDRLAAVEAAAREYVAAYRAGVGLTRIAALVAAVEGK